ncbi:MAG: ABC transporter ATP-binding protein/permease, partial [Firmicutes bacterium]|nr:ABC transporter ATP-binding protein/permease [Bacillota bacterium]
IMFVWALAIVSQVLMIIGPKILGHATDEIVSGMQLQITGSGGINFARIGQIMLEVMLLYGTGAVLNYCQGFVMAGLSTKVTYNMRTDISSKINRLPLRYFDGTTYGDVISRITNDVDTINLSFTQSLTQIVTSVTGVVGVLIMMLTISWRLTLVTLCVLPLSAVFVSLIVKKSQKHFFNQQNYLGKVNGHVEEMFGSAVIVRAFNGEEESVETFDGYNNTLYESARKANFLSGLMMPITTFIGNLAYVAVCVIGGSLVAAGSMTVGGIQAFIQYVRQFTQPISQLANMSNVLQQTAAAAERVFLFLGEEEETPDAPDALSVARRGEPASEAERSVSVAGSVGFGNVVFGYDPGNIIIHNFNAKVEPGQKIAIVGPTGAGKTTIVKLLMRFYDVNEGSISVDGRDIRLFKRNALRSVFGMVLQDTWLFKGTVKENIRYSRQDASDEDVCRAAKAAQVDHFVRTLPDGYDMVINEEADNISQGQKQLLTIARAILADPEILILDEATSSVDTRTEVLIQRAMDNLMKGRTSFVIAHRLSTIRNADMILCMHNGDIVEQGTHEELLAKGGFYAALYNSQFDAAG